MGGQIMIDTKRTTNGHAPPTSRAPIDATTNQRKMSSHRKTALAAGALYLLSFVSIPTLFLYNPLRASNYILGHGSNTGIIVGGILEMIVGPAGIGTPVALFPVVKRQNEGVALGFVGSRTPQRGGRRPRPRA